MGLAVEKANLSVDESDDRIHPKVGAVVARDGYILSTGFRGEDGDGVHAEESALRKLKPAEAIDATVYSTLEPCTTRGKTPCSLLLIKHRVGRLFYGMLDPNPDIRGQGEWLLEEKGIAIGKFEPNLVRTIKSQNADFIDYMLGVGLTITSPSHGETVHDGALRIEAVYRVRPRPGDRIHLFNREGNRYCLQMPIEWDRSKRTWACPRVILPARTTPQLYGIVVARVSEDFEVWVRSYSNVHSPPKNGSAQRCRRCHRDSKCSLQST